MAARRDAREAEAAKRARRQHHAKWIAINLALIAFTGWLYAAFLIPRFIVGDTAATRVGPDTWIADRPEQRSTEGRDGLLEPETSLAASMAPPRVELDQERPRLRREPQRTREYIDTESLRIIHAECIAGTVVRKRVVNGVPEITNIPGTYCR